MNTLSEAFAPLQSFTKQQQYIELMKMLINYLWTYFLSKRGFTTWI